MVTTSAGTKSIRPIPEGDASSFIIHDNSSEIVEIIPEKYVEPLIIIARIKGFDGVDDYVIHLIKDKLEMFADTRDDLDDAFQQYMHDMVIGRDVRNEWASHSTPSHPSKKTETEADDDTIKEDKDTKEEEERGKT